MPPGVYRNPKATTTQNANLQRFFRHISCEAAREVTRVFSKPREACCENKNKVFELLKFELEALQI